MVGDNFVDNVENLKYYFCVKFVNIVNMQYIEGKPITHIEYRSENYIFFR